MAMDLPIAPDFIRFLLSTKPKFDCYFKVGNPDQGEPERIGAVKLMLMAHSEVFRLELEDSDLKEKNDVPVKDVHSDTFKGMLKYTYGYDTTSEMCFDEADNLLYVAEKYMMKSFKDKLATRLMKLLNEDNICSLLNNPACYTHLELDAAITNILRHETDRVLASPQFLLTNADGFLKILEQDGLAVTEIHLWRAALKWAKHRADSEDGKCLREEMSSLTLHLRVLTLNGDETCEVITSDVLTKDEVSTVSLYRGKKEISEGLEHFSNKTEQRKILLSHKLKCFALDTHPANSKVVSSITYNCTILTKKHGIELLPLVCNSRSQQIMNPAHWTCEINCTITFTKVMNQYASTNTKSPPITLTFSENVKCGVEFEVPLAVDGRNIVLLSDNKYLVKMTFTGNHRRYYSKEKGTHENDHLMLCVESTNEDSDWYYFFPSSNFKYRVRNDQ